MVKTQHIIAVCLVLIVGMMAYNTFVARAETANLDPVLAQGSADRVVKEIMAVPFQRQGGEEAIAIIAQSQVKYGGDSPVKEWHLAMYALENRKLLKFIAVRRIQYDLGIRSWNNDRNNPSVGDLKTRWEKALETGTEEGD